MGAGDFLFYKGIKLTTGDQIHCVICSDIITDARIYVSSEDYVKSCGSIGYICQNLRDGAQSPDLLGYKSSWAFGLDHFDLDDFEYPVNIADDYDFTDSLSMIEKVNVDIFKNIVELSFPRKR